MGIRKTVTTLADGRELIYFDDSDAAETPLRARDSREPAPRPPTPELRLDPLLGDWVAIAPARQHRMLLPGAAEDPLAPQSSTNPSEIPGPYDVAVFENRYPAFGPDLLPDSADTLGADGDEELESATPAGGRCEVISFGPGSHGSLGELPLRRMRTVIEALADRTAALSALPGIRQVFPFENRGEAIGVTLPHPHGQIYAYPFVTPRMRTVLARTARRPGLFRRMLEVESASDRLLLDGEHWCAFVPFAARWPLEVHLLPKSHRPDLAGCGPAERDELAELYRRLLRALDRVYDRPVPYLAGWHQAPVREGRDEVRMILQLVSPQRGPDRLKHPASSESLAGAWLADQTPESTAARLRTALASAKD